MSNEPLKELDIILPSARTGHSFKLIGEPQTRAKRRIAGISFQQAISSGRTFLDIGCALAMLLR